MTRKRLTMAVAAILVAGIFVAPLHAGDAAALYKSKCFACHGEKGAGDSAMGKKLGVRPLGSPAVQSQSDHTLFEIIEDGKGKMPKFEEKISEADIKLLVAHIRTFKK